MFALVGSLKSGSVSEGRRGANVVLLPETQQILEGYF